MLLKQIHVVCAALTFISFTVRVYWRHTDSNYLRSKAVRIGPHVIDFFLLLTGLTLAIRYYGAFYQQPWLLLKLLGIILYIILGSVALRLGKSARSRLAAAVGAWMVFIYIVVMARSNAVIPY